MSSGATHNQFSDLAIDFTSAFSEDKYADLGDIAEEIRKILSVFEEDPPIDDLIQTGIVPQIIKFLDPAFFGYDKLVNECAWIITNIASGTKDHVTYLVSHDVIPKAIALLDHPVENVLDNSIWLLGNISGELLSDRDLLFNHNIVEKVVNLIDGKTYTTTFIAHLTWLVSNLCRGKPYPQFVKIAPFLPLLQFLIQNVNEIGSDETLINSLWALSYLSDGPDYHQAAIMELDITDDIITFMNSPNLAIQAPAIRLVGNLVSGDNSVTETLIQKGVLPGLLNGLSCENKTLRKEACWSISNILAGEIEQIDAVFQFQNGAIIQKLFSMTANEDPEIVREIVFCLCNACTTGAAAHTQILVKEGIIELLMHALENGKDVELLKISLEAIEKILAFNQDSFSKKIAEKGGEEKIEKLHNHTNQEVADLAMKISDTYF